MAAAWLLSIPAWAQTCEEHTLVYREEAPGCVDPGYCWYECTVCGHSEGYANLAPIGHDMGQWEVVTPASCTQMGQEQSVCSRCGDVQERETAKLGHEYGEGVLTKEPTLTAMGRVTYSCVRCDDSYTETTPKWTNPFLDLDKKGFYFDSVLWAYNNGITAGKTPQLFEPEGECTRAQVVTFLWRQAGEPVPRTSENVFSDVLQDAYYRDAVQWAVEQGIAKGISATEFGPDRPCTRCEVVTFLYRAKGCPEVAAKAGFWDVHPEDYYYEPVYWAYENAVTSGTGEGMFSPGQVCTRAQIVTFLYRARRL